MVARPMQNAAAAPDADRERRRRPLRAIHAASAAPISNLCSHARSMSHTYNL